MPAIYRHRVEASGGADPRLSAPGGSLQDNDEEITVDDMSRLIDRCTDKKGRVDQRMLHARGTPTDNHLLDPEDVIPDPLGGGPLVEAKAFSAEGSLDGRSYWVAVLWGGELGERVEIRGRDAEWVIRALTIRRGEEFQFAVPGPHYVLDLDDALSVLTALTCLSHDFEWHGNRPPRYPRFRQTGPDGPVIY